MATPIVIELQTARELLEYVSPLHDRWDNGRYIFRGQANEDYKLTPSICRRGVGSFFHGAANREFDVSSSGQVSFEIDVLKKFLEGCDRSGLVVPGYSERIKRRLFDNPHSFLLSDSAWPPFELYEIMATAQHHGIPTRLLDWTERSLVACYFAASSASLELKTASIPRLAIWALDTTYAKYWDTVNIIRTPGGSSRNQAAQSGLFTTHTVPEYRFDDVYDIEALEDVRDIYTLSPKLSPIMKITLPVNEAPKLLDLCKKLGVDGSSLFPGYSGVAKSVHDWANVTVGIRYSAAMRNEDS